MDLWKILVLGTLCLNCNWDNDKLQEIANNHHMMTISILEEMAIGNVVRIMLIERFIGHAERQINQIRRRVVKGEKIPR